MNGHKKTRAIGAGLVMCGAAALMTAEPASAQPISYVPCSTSALSAGIFNDGGTGTVTLALAAVFHNSPTNCVGSPSPVPGRLN
jgi:hypothetical protein